MTLTLTEWVKVIKICSTIQSQTIKIMSQSEADGDHNKTLLFSYDVASESEVTPCNKIDKPLVVYRFMGNVMTSITMLRTLQIITFVTL